MTSTHSPHRLLLLAPVLAIGVTQTVAEPTPPFVDTVTFLVEEGDGRDNLSEGSHRVQVRLVEELEATAEPMPGGDGFLHPFEQGTNVIAVIEGTESPEEVVILGAHYDGLGHDCFSDTPGDDVCDGAGDNAAGVAVVLEIGRRLSADPPVRSVVLALWDGEEDERLGSIAAVESGVFDLDSVVAYLNWDMQGINLLPSLADTTFVIGAEIGGAPLEDVVAAGVESTDLLPVDLSLPFGQGRSDHASFAEAGVPIVFFTDATSACYHTSQDDLAHLDLEKLGRQIDFGETVVRAVTGSAASPTFVADTAAASFENAESMLALVARMEPDLDRYSAADRAAIEQFRAALEGVVAEGEAAFDDDDVNALLAGTEAFVELSTEGECDGFLGARSDECDRLSGAASTSVAALEAKLGGQSPISLSGRPESHIRDSGRPDRQMCVSRSDRLGQSA